MSLFWHFANSDFICCSVYALESKINWLNKKKKVFSQLFTESGIISYSLFVSDRGA